MFCLPFSSFQSSFNLIIVSGWKSWEAERRSTAQSLLKIFRSVSLQPASWSIWRACWPIVHLTVVKATCVTRVQTQHQNPNQQVRPLGLVASLGEPFCLLLSWTCLLNSVFIFCFVTSLNSVRFLKSLNKYFQFEFGCISLPVFRNSSFYF